MSTFCHQRLPADLSAVLDRIDTFGNRISLTFAVPAGLLYLVSMTLWATGFEAALPASLIVFAPVWAPADSGHFPSSHCSRSMRPTANLNCFGAPREQGDGL